jgi:hypothetical protein
VSVNHFRSKKISEKILPAITDQSEGFGPERDEPNDPPGPVSMAFVKDLVASAQSKAVPLAPLKTILAKLIDAGVAEAEIPNRLMTAAGQLEALRSSLANWQDERPGHEQIRSKPWRLSTAAISIPRARW